MILGIFGVVPSVEIIGACFSSGVWLEAGGGSFPALDFAARLEAAKCDDEDCATAAAVRAAAGEVMDAAVTAAAVAAAGG